MSLKDLFGKSSGKILVGTSPESASYEIESYDLLTEELEERKKFLPKIDYTDPSNFAFYGSAEKYYVDAIENIYKKYPYDGSIFEKTKWKKEASDLENYIFENEYPRNNGFIKLGFSYGSVIASSDDYSLMNSNEYIFFKGGPNTSQNTDSQKLKVLFGTSNVYDPSKNRDANLEINGNNGLTTEFWFKKDSISGSSKQVVFDLWNSSSFATDTYGRFRVEIRPNISGDQNKFFIELMSGSSGIYSVGLGSSLNLTSSTWNHYAITAINTGSNLEIKLYKDGLLNDSIITGTSINKVTGSMLGWIGSLGTSVSGTYAGLGYGKLSGSLDEFRYWKSKRTDKNIAKYWFTQIGGGTNTDDANTDLGVYFKFNEGIFSTGSVNLKYDAKVLDYSGRFSNGYWTGYTIGSRSTESAIVNSNAADFEFEDPVVYSEHPDVQSLLEDKQKTGKLYDNSNTSYMYYTYPSWIIDEDQENERNRLLELSQILSSYFDELFLKIKHLPTLKEVAYRDGRPLPYGMKLLESMGFMTQDLFTDTNVLENIQSRTEEFEYEDRIYNLKNHIYQNIYNNLSYIQKSKGTEKSIRNLIRCFGIDDELIKLNTYSNDAEFTFDNRYILTTSKKKYANFNNPDRFQATIYQTTASGDSNSQTFIPGNSSLSYFGQTLEAEVIFPLKNDPRDSFYFSTYFLTSSLFGIHEANPSNQSDYTWYSTDNASIQVYSILEDYDTKDGYIMLSSSHFGIELTSSLIKDLYTNEKWNFALKIKHEKYPISNFVLDSNIGDYILELYMVNVAEDLRNQNALLTASISQAAAESFFAANKRIYAGSHRQNFTGSILHNTDVKISSIRYWLSYLEDEIIDEHGKDPTSFGNSSAYGNLPVFKSDLNVNLDIPQIESLALHWDFSNVTGSDNGSGTGPANSYDAKFFVEDLTSGSANTVYGAFGNITKKRYPATGDFFLRNKTNVVEKVFVPTARHLLPEVINSSEMIQILNEDEQIFTKDTLPINYYFALEKSMYQTISEEIIKFFGSIIDFNNIIGRPQYKYEREYRDLIKLRQLFFDKIGNTPDLEKYVDYFKWIDTSITKMVMQLIPASADFSDQVSNLVESHVLERNKYAYKLPSIELGAEPPISSAKTIGELKYNWKFGHAPINGKENTNCIWWKERKERESDLNGIFQTLSTEYKKKFTKVSDFGINIVTVLNKNSSNVEVVKPATNFGSGEYLEMDVLKIIEKKDCSDD